MSNSLIALMFGVGVGGWVYYTMMRYTGGDAKTSWMVSGFVAAIAFFVFYSAFTWVFNF